jgi:hypothetical protein
VERLLTRSDVQVAIEDHLVVLSLAAVSVDALDAITNTTEPHRLRYQSRGRVISVVRTSMGLPDAATRKRLNELYFQDNSPGKIVTVIDATGFWAATVRGILASASLITTKASHTVGSIEEALKYVDFTGDDVARLATAIRAFRDEHYALIAREKAEKAAKR